MFAILHSLGMFAADLFKPWCRLEAENLFLRHQLSIALRRRPPRFRLRGGDRALLVWMTRLWPSLLGLARIVEPATILRWHRAGFRTYWRRRSRSGRRAHPDDRLRPLHLAGATARTVLHHGDFEHGAVAGGHVQHFRSSVRAAGHRQLDHQLPALVADAADAYARPGAGTDLPAWLAIRVAGDRVGVPAYLLSGRGRHEDRHGVVRRAGRSHAADRVSVATGGDVGLLPQTGGQG